MPFIRYRGIGSVIRHGIRYDQAWRNLSWPRWFGELCGSFGIDDVAGQRLRAKIEMLMTIMRSRRLLEDRMEGVDLIGV